MNQSYICVTCEDKESAATKRTTIMKYFNIRFSNVLVKENEVIIPLPLKEHEYLPLNQLEAFVYPCKLSLLPLEANEKDNALRYWYPDYELLAY